MLPAKVETTITITTIITTKAETTDKDDVSLVAVSEEEEAQVTMAAKEETKEDKVAKVQEVVKDKEIKVANKEDKEVKEVKVALPEEDVPPEESCPTELHLLPLCSWPISHSNSMTRDLPSCSKIRKSQRPM
jgi:hypothetical protein